MAQGAGGEGEDDSDEDDDDDEGSDDDDMMGEGSDDEDDDEDDSDDDDDEEEEELPKGKGKGASMTPAAGDKRKGAPASTPAPATGGKKARVEETPKGGAAPATGKKEKGEVPKTPKTPAAGAGQGTDALKKQWEEAIVQVLKQKGPQTPGGECERGGQSFRLHGRGVGLVGAHGVLLSCLQRSAARPRSPRGST